jgi:uncharacterized membrane protein
VLGGILGLVAAVTFALNNATVRRGVLTGTATQAMVISLPVGLLIFLLAAAVSGHLATVTQFSTRSLIFLITAGIIHFAWGRYCNYRATKAMGANLVGPVQQISLVLTLALAIWILGETLTVMKIIGIALVVLGPAVTLPERGAKKTETSETEALPVAAAPKFQPNYLEGYSWAMLSNVGYGVSPILVKLALEHRGLGASIAGGLVAYAAATAVVVLFLFWPGQFRHLLTTRRDEVAWFTVSGVLICLSQMFLYMGYAIAPVSVVSPIQRLSIVFRVHAGWLINRQHEAFGGRIILATITSLLGAVALSLSSNLVSEWLPLPAALTPLMQWHWP